jgi:uncharacterized membrane protein
MPVDLTPDERRLRAQIAANARWSKPGARETQSDKLRRARLTHYARQVDPAGTLPPDERARLAENALRADMQRLALRSSKARRARKRGSDA